MSLAGVLSPEQEALVRFLISNCLSYGVVFGAMILKVPQIINIMKHNSAEGISLASNMFEVTGFVIATSWGVAQGLNFKDYGENMFILVQMAILLLLVGKMQNSIGVTIAVLVGEASFLYALSTGMVDRTIHEWLLSVQIFFGIFSRVPQILLNYKNKFTGQLSFLTFFLAFGGGCARVMTTFLNVPKEKGKYVLLTQFGVAVTLNFIIILQILKYRSNKNINVNAAFKTTAAKLKKNK